MKKKLCNGTIYKISKKYYCVGEKISKKVNGKTKITYSNKISSKNKSSKNKSSKNK
jgi:hypothetical protein